MTIGALAELEAGELLRQVHLEPVEDTRRFLKMFVCNMYAERERWYAARARHDHLGEAESAAEWRELTILAGICLDHLKLVEPPWEPL